MAEVSLTFDDVGFSHETLELARHSDEAETERALDALAPDGEAATPADGDAADAPQRRGRRRSRSQATGWVDAEGNPIASPHEEVAQMLADEPPAFDFARYTEVTITRRLYRDGTSQYFINKTPCRLRDITDFFLGTGVGTKAYAIIEQGRIGQIVSSRPQDRRAIIEEAAGITKFKAKKKAAEKKLDQTRQNLMRVSDIVDRARQADGHAAPPGAEGRALPQVQGRAARHRAVEGGAPLARARGRGQARRRPARARRAPSSTTRAPRGRRKDAHVVAERAELASRSAGCVGVQEHVYELDNRLRLGESKIGVRAARGRRARRRGSRPRATRSTRSPRSASAAPRSSRRADRARAARGRGRARGRARSRRARPRPARRASC